MPVLELLPARVGETIPCCYSVLNCQVVMQTLIEIIGWPETILNEGGIATIGLCAKGNSTCIMPSSIQSEPQVKLVDLLPLGSYLAISDKVTTLKYPPLSPLCILYYINLLHRSWMFFFGKKHSKVQTIFDELLAFFNNPGIADEFPFNSPLQIKKVHDGHDLGHIPAVVLFDENTGNEWTLPTLLFCHIKYISVDL